MALRRALAVLLTLLVVLETGGAARAFAVDATVHCCCGEHSGARRCDCKACPVGLRGQHQAPTGDRLDAGRTCGASADATVLLMVALSPPAPVVLLAEPPARMTTPPPPALSSTIVSAKRPPP